MGGAPPWTGTWHATGRPAGTKASQVPHHWLMTPPFFYSTHRQTCGTRCCCLSCNRLSKAVPELQQLLLSGLPEHVANLGPEFREAAWRDLAEVVGQDRLPCCTSSSRSLKPRIQHLEWPRAPAAPIAPAAADRAQLCCCGCSSGRSTMDLTSISWDLQRRKRA